MRDDDNQSFDTFDPADGDEPRPEFVEELLGDLEATWHSRADGLHTDPSADPIDITVFEQGNEPMGKNRLTAILAGAAAIVLLIVGIVAITGDDDDAAETDTALPGTTDPPTTEPATTEPPPTAPPTTDPPPTVTVAPDRSFDITYIEVDAGNSVAANEDFAWVVGASEGMLSTIDLATNTVVSTAELPAGSRSTWYGFGSVWIGNEDGTLARFDPDAGEIVATIEVGDGRMGWLEPGVESIWHARGNEVVRIDPNTNTVVARITAGDETVGGVHVNAAGGWLRDDAGTVYRIDTDTNTVVATIETPLGMRSMIASPDAVWAPSIFGNVARIDPATNSVIAEIDVGAAVGADPFVTTQGLHVSGGSLWVKFGVCDGVQCEPEGDERFAQGVARIDIETNEVVSFEILRDDFTVGQGGMSAGPTTAWTQADGAIARIDY